MSKEVGVRMRWLCWGHDLIKICMLLWIGRGFVYLIGDKGWEYMTMTRKFGLKWIKIEMQFTFK